MAKSTQKQVDDLNYEEALAELETLVAALEGEQYPLDDAMKMFERGQALIKRCAMLLDKAELKVKQLSEGALSDFSGENDAA